jgi:CHASE3 domain sensor protein
MTMQQSDFVHKLTAWLVSLCTLLVTGCFVFLWQIHATIAVSQEKDFEHDRNITTLQEQTKLLNTQYQNLDTRTSILEHQNNKK